MKRNAMRKNLRQSILKSMGRYIAICAIIGLGAGLFVGLLMSKTDMVATGQVFTDEQNMYDFRLVSNYGWTEEYVQKAAALEGVETAEGVTYLDLIASMAEETQDSVYRFYTIPHTVNKIALRGGRMPEKPNECLADGFYMDDSCIGKTVQISDTNEEDSLEALKDRTFTIVGYVATPLYMDNSRGSTTVGNGRLENYFYVLPEAIDLDYFVEINITIPGEYAIYTEEYSDALEAAQDVLEPQLEELAERRFWDVRLEAEEEYNDGYQEYLDGLREYEDGKAEAIQELADALQELTDGEQELKDSRLDLINAENEIEEGREQIEVVRRQINDGKAQLKKQKAEALPKIEAAKKQLDSQYAQAKEGYNAASDAVKQAQAGVDQVKAAVKPDTVKENISKLNKQLSAKKKELSDASEEEKIAIQEEINSISAQISGEEAKLIPYNTALGYLEQAKAGKSQAKAAMSAIEEGQKQLKAQKKQLSDAENELLDAEIQMWAGEKKLNEAYDQVMVGWGEWHKGKEDLAQGWIDYEEAKIEVEEELAEAEAELEDAKLELADAREEIDSMEEWDLFILDRSSNIGYNNLDSSSDIVAGVSRVFPVFFLLVASLVCITTMTRMIDEERTQIGTLKALGYSNNAIISKYLFYSGSGAVLGCGLGICFGCYLFPQIIWYAYCIMLYIQPNVVLKVDWLLCGVVTGVYTVVMLFVTWYCCHKTLEEEPAQLIRPKAPDAGKKILLEHLRIWNRLKFLNKVAIRNIFRYKQRLAMMLVGIGGCTALLVTGFGLRDSIVNVVDDQFETVTKYDLDIYYRDIPDQEEWEETLKILDSDGENVMLYHQSSVDLDFGARVKEIYMVCADERLPGFIDMHKNSQKIPVPALGEAVLSRGVCESMGIQIGDSILLRDADMRELNLKVSGIYDNFINNYVIVTPETVSAQWGSAPEQKMAFVRLDDDWDVHLVSAELAQMDSVMNVSINEDLASMVRGMMEALDLLIVVIVICAALLAVIVLYNLTNININERIREIATIKVLGFNASETGAYVFKENMILTVVGAVLGLGLGWLLLLFVMTQVRIDFVCFNTQVEPISYVWSICLTLLASLAVDFIFYFKLQKINMAEALKSVE